MDEKDMEVVEVEMPTDDICDKDMGDYTPLVMPMILEDEEMDSIRQTKEYKEGLSESAYYIGLFEGLVSAGMDVIVVHQLLANQCVARSNQIMGKISAKSAKYMSHAKENLDI